MIHAWELQGVVFGGLTEPIVRAGMFPVAPLFHTGTQMNRNSIGRFPRQLHRCREITRAAGDT